MKEKTIARAYQVSPEHQNPHFDIRFYDDIIFIGNRRYRGNDSESDFGQCTKRFHDIQYVVEEIQQDEPDLDVENIGNDRWRDILYEVGLDRPKEGGQYTDDEIREFAQLWGRWGSLSYAHPTDKSFEEDLEIELYSLWKGRRYLKTMLRGCSQGDWIEIVYPAENYSDGAIRSIGSEYFNTGTEWHIAIGECSCDGVQGCPCEERWDGFYCYVTDNLNTREVLEGCLVEGTPLEVYEFAGYTKTPKYKLME